MQKPDFPWLEHYPEGVDWNLDIAPRPVFSLLQDAAQRFSARPAFDFLGKKYTWMQIETLARKMAKGLQGLGIGKGQSIGIFLPNCPYYLVSYYAVLMTGARVVNLNPLYAEGELAHLIEDSETDIIITADLALLYNKMQKMREITRLKKLIVCPFTKILPFPKNVLFPIFKCSELAEITYDENVLRYDHLIKNDGMVQIPTINAKDDIAILQYTGGTTGTPKAAMLTHANVYTNAMQAKMWFADVRQGEDKMLGVLPFFHVFAMTAVMNFSVAMGLEIVALPRFDLKDTLKTIHKKKVTLFPAVPAIYGAINASPLRTKYDLSSLKYCLSGGAPLPVEVKQTFEKNTGCIVIEGYGLTESSPVACVNPVHGENKAGSIGLPWPQTIVEIIDPADKKTPMPEGERGELCIRGPQVMKGYWKNEAATSDVIRKTENGETRLYTGDVAIMDAQGYVFIVDRIKDMIITNGYKVFPRNVEEAIYQHPAVEECIVAGIPDEQRGELVKAWIKLRDGLSLTEQDLKIFLREKISPMEIPKRIEFRETPLPKTMIGKLSKKDVLKEEKL